MEQNNDFLNQTVIVTGAGKGIGRAVALMLASRGASIIAVSRTQEDLISLEKEIGARIIAADLGNLQETQWAAQQAVPADYLVNCAGTTALDKFIDLSADTFDHIMAVNTRSALIMSQAYARDRISQGKAGAIVNVSSISSKIGFAEHTAYCASKGALDAMTKVMGNELGSHDIRVNTVNPIVTLTPMAVKAWSDPKKAAPILNRIPINRFIEPNEVAEAICFLLGNRASGINGTSLFIDGGFLTR
ncbi:SDR family oxidoreductase [Bartonella sp. HY329]|uniref:SDR family oxidoreductase n=1 Tax=unclassified Bartonella TaxID=2645622 RepID=UPI0021CA3251|nr:MULTISPECIES: SDR family oxidoreductase [unclassified Bartonella]UXM94907.1 SDR family oxidoreductase [Bartonella sp. HY329]UXN09230.1 SDR family oxidoreductase [Bartonella sp. HY328]